MFNYRIEDYTACQISRSLERTARTNGKVIGFIMPCIEHYGGGGRSNVPALMSIRKIY